MNARTFCAEESLRDGTRVTIRAARPDDRERIAKAFAGLDRESIYTRFFSYKTELREAELAQIDAMDFVRDVLLVVTVARDGDEIIVASARYIAPGRAPVAEVAFTVEEDYQGRGLASRLLRHLIAIACHSGIERFEADVLAGNKAMLAVFERSGLPVRQQREGGVVHLELVLGRGD
jgi:RimJ/RimL family protein N-acetyltransferase